MSDENEPKLDDRRAFLSAAGKFALTVPPAMTFLLSTTLTSNAIANSCNQGLGNGPDGCDPGNSATTNDDGNNPPGNPGFNPGNGDPNGPNAYYDGGGQSSGGQSSGSPRY